MDYTSGPVGRALGLLAIPMMLEMSMESIFAVVDIAFVSRLGTDAVAAVGITEALVTVLYGIAIGLGMGVTAMVSRRVGAKDNDAAATITGQTIWLGVGYPMYAVGMIMIQALNGAGDTSTPSALNLLCFWLVQIPLAFWLAKSAALGPDGVFLAIVISESLLTVLSVILFRRGAWKHRMA